MNNVIPFQHERFMFLRMLRDSMKIYETEPALYKSAMQKEQDLYREHISKYGRLQ